MKVLITGGAGFIGSHTADLLLEKGHEVAIIDNFFSGRKENINKDAEVFEQDILNKDKIKEIILKTKPEAILHLAATVSPLRSVKNPLLDAQINIQGTLSLYSALAETMEENFLKKIVVASSQTTYGEGKCKCKSCGWEGKPAFRQPKNLSAGKFEHFCPVCNFYPLTPVPTPESFPQDPSMPYGVSKLAEEKYLLSFSQIYGIDGIALRYFNVYGTRQTSQGMEAAVSAIFFNKLLHGEQPLAFEDGNQTRDFVYVSDVAESNRLVIEKARGIKKYNVGCGAVSIKDLGKLIAEKLGVNIEVKITGKPRYAIEGRGTIDTRHCIADTSLINKELGWKPKIGIESGIEKTAEWCKENKSIL